MAAELDQKLLDILVCPLTKGPLVYDREVTEAALGRIVEVLG